MWDGIGSPDTGGWLCVGSVGMSAGVGCLQNFGYLIPRDCSFGLDMSLTALPTSRSTMEKQKYASEKESRRLIELVGQFKDVLLDKRTDYNSMIARKAETWQRVTDLYMPQVPWYLRAFPE